MKRRIVSVFALSVSLAMTASIVAQAPQGPPALLKIYREEVKLGKNAAHEKVEMGYVRALSKTGVTYLGLQSVTGPNEAWFMERHDSYTALEKLDQAVEKTPGLLSELAQLDAQDGELRSGGRVIIATQNRGASYRADAVQALLPKARYVQVQIVRVRPGRGPEYLATVRAVNAALEKMKVEQPRGVWNVASGMPGPTYLMFSLRTSLASFDPPATQPGMTFAQAMGGQEAAAKNAKTVSEVVLSQETLLFKINPKMSRMTPEVVDADKEFWAPKPKAAAAKKAE